MRKYSLSEVLEWKYGLVANTRQADPNDKSPDPEMIISEWRHPDTPQPTEEQLAEDFAGYTAYREAEEQKKAAREVAKQALRDKHRGKKASQLTQADVMEFMKLKMAEELDLNLT